MIAEEVQLDPRPIRIPPRLKPNDAVELNGVFTPDLKEFFFARRRTERDSIILEDHT